MREPKTCEHCGAKIVEYKHGLSKGLMRVLYRIIQLRGGIAGEFEFKDVKLNYNQGSNFQKLKYWGLIDKVGCSDGHGGTWTLTSKGLLFAAGRISLRKFVRTYRGVFVAYEGEEIRIKDITDGWQYRSEYASEATLHK